MTAYELATRRVFNDSENPDAQTVWQVDNASNYQNARAQLDAALPTAFQFPSGRVAYLDQIAATELRDNEFFEFAIVYRSQPLPTFGELEYEFDVSADDETVFQSLATASYIPVGERPAPNFDQGIGVPTITGAVPLKPVSVFRVTKHWAAIEITTAVQYAIEQAIGKTNTDTFFDRPPGTVRFLGARGRRSGDKFPISYEFGFRPNRTSVTFGNLTLGTVNGFNLIDPLYIETSDPSARRLTRKLRAVYVHRIHRETSLASALGINSGGGTPPIGGIP
jgi:hypothetical protein